MSLCLYLSPQADHFPDQLRDFFQSGLIFFGETVLLWTVYIQNAEDLSVFFKGKHDLDVDAGRVFHP